MKSGVRATRLLVRGLKPWESLNEITVTTPNVVSQEIPREGWLYRTRAPAMAPV
jgi:hypothetical protein